MIGTAAADVPRVHTSWGLFGILNVLNGADAALTWLVINAGIAREGNPVLGAIGIPGKMILVAVAGFLLMLIRPRALWIPIGALGAVIVWTIGGWLYFA